MKVKGIGGRIDLHGKDNFNSEIGGFVNFF
jgi:hypothetical protein